MKKRMLQRLLSGILVFSIIMGTGQHLVLASEIQGQISDENALDSVEEDSQDNSAEESTQSILPEETEEESQAEQLPSEETEEEEVLQEEAEEDLEPASSVSEKEIAAWEEKQLSQGFLDLGPDHLDAQNGVSTAAEGIENADTGSASFSKINNLLVLVRFQDQTEDYMNAQNSARLDATYNSTSMQGSMKDYVKAMSYGELTVDTSIFPRSESTMYCSVQVEHTIDYYLSYSEAPVITDNTERGYMTSEERFAREKALCDEVLSKVKAEIEAELTEAQLDENGDGYIDSISFAFDTVAADAKGRIQYADLLWPHKTSYASPVTIHGLYMSSYNFLSRGTDNVGMMGSTRQITSTAVHEFMHTLGLPDLYHYTKSGSPVGGWDVMASTTSSTPQRLNAYYQREYMQWGDPLEIVTVSQQITLTSPDFLDGSEKYAVKLVSPYNTKEFFVAEFRNLEGYDHVLPDADYRYTPGLLVYRIVEEDASNNVYVWQGNRTGDDAMYIFRPSETGVNACTGNIANAALNSQKSDWNTIGKEAGAEESGFDANILSFYNGDNSGIVIRNVVQSGDTISFDVEIPSLQGSGTIQDPYQITRAEDLQMLNDSEGKYFRLMNDLDLQNYEHNSVSRFQGTFDGNGKTIRNLSVVTDGDSGLFQSVGVNGTVKNLILESVQITGEGSVGAVAGVVSGTIQNVEVRSGAVICTSGIQKIVGGIAGYVEASGKVTDCVSYASVTGEEVGGIAGRVYDGYIADCFAAGTVNGTGTAPKTGAVFGIYYVSDSYKQPVNLYWDVERTGQNIVGNSDNSFNSGTVQYPGNVGVGLSISIPSSLKVNSGTLKAVLNPELKENELVCNWNADKPQVIRVSADGATVPTGAGNAVITCSFKVGSHSCRIQKQITVESASTSGNVSSEPLAFKWATMGSETVKIGESAKLYYAVNKNAIVTVEIYYGDNRFLRRLVKNASIKTNDQVAVWDLKDASGRYVENGKYRYTITATDENGKSISVHRWFDVTGNDPLAFQWAILGKGTVSIGDAARLYYAVNRNASVTVDIYYGDNRFLKRLITNAAIKTNDQMAVWDLRDALGRYVENGTYRYTITATDENGKSISVHRWFNVTGNDPLAFQWATLGRKTVNIGDEARLYYAVNKNASVTVEIYYGDNRFLRRLVTNAAIKTNDQVAVWDLKDASGRYVENGTYRYTITATDENGKSVSAHQWFNVAGRESFDYKWMIFANPRVERGSSARLYYATNRNAVVTIDLYYGNNRYMKTLVKNKKITTTDQVVEWNLTDENKRAVSAGTYRFTVTAVDEAGNRIVSHRYLNVVESAWKPVIKEEELIVSGLKREYKLLFVADSHMMTMDQTDTEKIKEFEPVRVSGFMNAQKMTSSAQFPQIIKFANENGIDVFMMGGDIIDFPSENNLGLLKGYLSELKCQYLYAPGNHDWTYIWEDMLETCRDKYRPLLNDFVGNGTLEAQMLEYQELILLSVDNSTNQIAPEAIPLLKQALKTGKPIVIMMHVPLQSDSLIEKVNERWGSTIILGEDGIRPNAVSEEFLQLVFAEDSTVVAILDGHVHLPDISRLDNDIMQYTANVGSSGEALLLKIRGN